MGTSTGRLSRAFEVQSVARLGGDRSRTLEAPAATLVAVPVCEARTRGLTTPHSFPTYEGADMAKRTRLSGRSGSETQPSGVKITPPQCPVPVATTPTVA
jgi:hypothetical protein